MCGDDGCLVSHKISLSLFLLTCFVSPSLAPLTASSLLSVGTGKRVFKQGKSVMLTCAALMHAYVRSISTHSLIIRYEQCFFFVKEWLSLILGCGI